MQHTFYNEFLSTGYGYTSHLSVRVSPWQKCQRSIMCEWEISRIISHNSACLEVGHLIAVQELNSLGKFNIWRERFSILLTSNRPHDGRSSSWYDTNRLLTLGFPVVPLV